MTYRRLIELRNARVERYREEAKSMEEQQNENKRNQIRNKILKP